MTKQLDFGQPLFFILQKKTLDEVKKKEKEEQVASNTHDKNVDSMLAILAWTTEQVLVKTHYQS